MCQVKQLLMILVSRQHPEYRRHSLADKRGDNLTGGPGSMQLGPAESSHVVQRMRTVRSIPSVALMVAMPAEEGPPLDAAVVDSPIIQWIAQDSSKPGGVGAA